MQNVRLTKNRSGYWQITWNARRADGSWGTVSRSCGTKDVAVAETVKTAFLADQKELATREKAAQGVRTFDALVDLYLREHVARNDIKDTQAVTLKGVRTFFGPHRPDEITPALLNAYRDSRANARTGKPVSTGTLRRDIGVLAAVLNWARKLGHLPATCPLPYIERPQDSPARESFLEEHEQDALVRLAEATGDAKLALFVRIALATGSRRESIESLDWRQVTLIAGREEIDFRNLKVRQTAKRRVRQPMADELIPVLRAAWEAAGRPLVGPVFGYGYTVRWAWQRLRAASPWPELRVHDLRRSAAIRWARAGVPLWHVAGLLGDSVKTTEAHYARHAPGDYMRAAINARRAA